MAGYILFHEIVAFISLLSLAVFGIREIRKANHRFRKINQEYESNEQNNRQQRGGLTLAEYIDTLTQEIFKKTENMNHKGIGT